MAYKHASLSLLVILLVNMGFSSLPTYARSNSLVPALQPNLAATVPNFAVVTPQLWRGGLPKQGGIGELKRAGVKTIINLIQDGNTVENERALAHDLDMNFVHIPLNHFKSLRNDQVEKFLATVRNPELQPVFVHCNQGQDRAGTMIGIYRVTEQNWTARQAYDEMLSFGFHPFFYNLTGSVYSAASEVGRPEALPNPFQIGTDLKIRFKRVLSTI